MNISTDLNNYVSQVKVSQRQQKNETIAAMLDAEKIAKDSSIKGYKDLDELFEELNS